DANAGLRFRLSRWVDKTIMLGRGHGFVRNHCRTVVQWRQALASHGFNSKPVWMSQGTPFANVLLIAEATRKPATVPLVIRVEDHEGRDAVLPGNRLQTPVRPEV